MPATKFICPNGEKIKISECLRMRVHKKILSVIMPFLSFYEMSLLCEKLSL